MRLQSISALLPSAAKEATSKERIRLEGIITTLKMASQVRIQKEHPAIQTLSATLNSAATTLIAKERTRLENLEKLTNVLNPASTLKRGYSITKIGGKAVGSADKAKPGDILETIMAEGIIKSIVEATGTK